MEDVSIDHFLSTSCIIGIMKELFEK